MTIDGICEWMTWPCLVAYVIGFGGITVVYLLKTRASTCPQKAALGKYWDRNRLKTLVSDAMIDLPAMIVDLDVFEANCQLIVGNIRRHNTGKIEGERKKLRIATKSVRCPALLRYIEKVAGQDLISGYMCYSVHEVALLAEQGFTHFYVPYPTVQRGDLQVATELVRKGVDLTLTVDCPQHVHLIDRVLEDFGAKVKIKLAIDLDVSFKMAVTPRLGAHRSRVHAIESFAKVHRAIEQSRWLSLTAVMG